MEFLRSFLRRHLEGKPVMASENVSCFLRIAQWVFLFLWRRGGKYRFPHPYACSTVQLTCRWSFRSRSVFLLHGRFILRWPENAKTKAPVCAGYSLVKWLCYSKCSLNRRQNWFWWAIYKFWYWKLCHGHKLEAVVLNIFLHFVNNILSNK